ncbi:MAG TPA: ArsA-related P-loop ATPase, partial [Myxococcota bacterium]|nr:ArsA-related P-loop ATPase [Myxococcota bacterium]
MTATLASLLSRRLLLVTGKGGTGKTRIAAALGVLAAREGVRTVVVELGDSDVLPELLPPSRPLRTSQRGREPQPVAENLFTLRLAPEEALLEYLELQLHVRTLARAIVGNAAFHRFLDAAPGWRELITLGKLWHLASLEQRGGAPRWPLVVVDAPATGHGLSLLSVPSVVLDTVRMGPLRRNTDRVQALMTDAARTLVLPVTLPEELPVNETLELRARVRELGVGLGPVLANGVEPPLGLAAPERALAALARVPLGTAPSPLAEPEVAGAAARHRLARAAMQRGFLAELERALGEPPVELPWLPRGVDDAAGVGALADALRGAL